MISETETECVAAIGLAAFAYLLRTTSVEHDCTALIVEASEMYEKRSLETGGQQQLLCSGLFNTPYENQQQQIMPDNFYAQAMQAGSLMSLSPRRWWL